MGGLGFFWSDGQAFGLTYPLVSKPPRLRSDVSIGVKVFFVRWRLTEFADSRWMLLVVGLKMRFRPHGLHLGLRCLYEGSVPP